MFTETMRRFAAENETAMRPQPLPAPSASPVRAAHYGPTLANEVAYISGVDSGGRITANSYWSAYEGVTAFKFGASTAGTGATISYAYDAISNFTATEKATFERALAEWSSVADVRFVASATATTADVLLHRGSDGQAYTQGAIEGGSGAVLGHRSGQALISIDTSVTGFDLSGSLDRVGGYGYATAVHEIGHAIGLGHAGAYDFTADPATDQYSVFDTTLYSTMSYFSWTDQNLRYGPAPDVDWYSWGTGSDGHPRTSAHTAMGADILAIQALYGAARQGPFSTAQVFGFGSTVAGPLADVFDFSKNVHPVVTLYSTTIGNTLDLSGYSVQEQVDLRPGGLSDVGGMGHNLAIAAKTWIDDYVGGRGIDKVVGNDHPNRIDGGGGHGDYLIGEGGNDILIGGDGTALFGGTGDDRYYMIRGNAFETNGDGFDRVYCSGASCTVSDGVEVVTFTSAVDAIGLTGNTATTLYGNAGNDQFRGGHGGDRLVGAEGNDTLYGVDGDDQLVGGSGTDLLDGGRGENLLMGGNGADRLVGGLDADMLDGGTGADRMEGGGSSDHYLVDSVGDVIVEAAGAGRDLVTASVATTLSANVEDLELTGRATRGTGNASANTLTGGAGGDTLAGMDGYDTLYGVAGGDRLDGGAGNDILTGGVGADLLTGGVGADRFVYFVGDSGAAAGEADRVADFHHAEHDRIDLSALATGGALTFVGVEAFSGLAGEVRFAVVGAEALVTADLDGDRFADLAIRLTGVQTLVAADLLLGV